MNYNKKDYDYEKSVENSIMDENNKLIGNISSNIREFKMLNYTLNDKINSTNTIADSLNEKFDKSREGVIGNMKHLAEVVSNKQGKVCWFIVLIFISIFFIRYFIYLNNKHSVVSQKSIDI